MLLEEIKNIKASEQVLRKFGFLLAAFLSILGAISFWKEGTLYLYLFPAAGVSLISAILFPKTLKGIYLPWMAVATMIGWVMTRIILTVFYYVAMTSFGLVAKIFGKDLLDEKIEPQKKSYWIAREQKAIAKHELERQF